MNDQLRVLILEDNLLDYELMLSELSNLYKKLDVKHVDNEADFKKELVDFAPEIILSDYSLPQYNGMEALKHTLSVAPEIPIIIVTGSINEEVAVDCIKAGAADYVTKEHISRLGSSIKSAFEKFTAISERKKAQQNLELSERKYRTLFEKSTDPILLIKDNVFSGCNDATVQFLGYENKNEIQGKTPHELSPEFQPDGEKSIEKASKMMDIALRDGRNNFEWVHTKKDGTDIWVDVSLTFIPGGNNSVGSIHTIWRDISKRKLGERIKDTLLKISEEIDYTDSLGETISKIHLLLGNILNNENFYCALYNEEKNVYSFPFYIDKFDTVDPSFEENLENTITDYIRKTGKAMLISPDIEAQLSKSEKIKLVGQPSPVWIGAPLFDNVSEKIIGVIAMQDYDNPNAYNDSHVSILQYVARNIGTLIHRKKAESLIKDSEEQFRSLTETATDAIIMMNENSEITVWNNGAQRIFGYTQQEIINKKVHEILIPSQYKKKADEATEEFQLTGKGNLIGKTLEMSGKKKDGSLFPIELSISSIKKNNVWHATGIIRDITYRKIQELELKKAKDKAEESDKLKTAFLANMSHEIRTPMNAILGFSELLALPEIEDEEKDEFIKLIQNNSNSLLNLINDIIDIAKIEAGQLKIHNSEFQLKELLSELYKTYIEIQSSKGITDVELVLKDDNIDDNLYILSDQNRIKQVLSNLIGNAVKYTLKGRIEFGFSIDLDEKNFLTFYVKDTGIGIAQDKIEVIFDRFRQADDSYTRVYGGTGLGLAISQNIAKMLGGKIDAISAVEEGSTFYFSIPYDSMIEKQQIIQKENKINIDNSKLEGLRVLIAEDVESNYLLLETYLLKIKSEIIWVKNGQEAVDYCTNNEVDIVLMDMQMPVLNGYEATKLIKSIKPNIPIIAETAFALAGDKEKILEAGCDDYISKPIKSKELIAKMRNFFK